MIEFESLEARTYELKTLWNEAMPFRMLTVDGFVESDQLAEMLDELPEPERSGIKKSRDYVFAKNKYEKSEFSSLGRRSSELYADLTSKRFERWLSSICGRNIWVDREFHGGGLHQGGPGSFLDMHVDFNVHPLHSDWMRDLNILLYLNRGWRREYGGQLKLRNRKTGVSRVIEPVFNRCVIMETRDYTLHGYDAIDFPDGEYRRSIACYAYSLAKEKTRARSTIWYPEQSGALKGMAGRVWPTLVRWKGRLLGSGTTRNR